MNTVMARPTTEGEMSTERDDGGPAFPSMSIAYDGSTPIQGGMSLRDWLAGQALAGRMARPSIYTSWADAATDAYEAADAMLAERSK